MNTESNPGESPSEETPPTAGTLLRSYCAAGEPRKRRNKTGVYADGNGGTYEEVIEEDCAECPLEPDPITDLSLKLEDDGPEAVYRARWKHAGEGSGFEFGSSHPGALTPLSGPERVGTSDDFTATFSVSDLNPGDEFCIGTVAGIHPNGLPLAKGTPNGITV